MWNREEFEQKLREHGTQYHTAHPFQEKMIAGKLSKEEMRCWIANRFYYQKVIPLKDATILSKCTDRSFRKKWITRILDHDGYQDKPGGIEAWLLLARSAGLQESDLLNDRLLLPGVRFAVDHYLHFVRNNPWEEGVCACLTELFAGNAHRQRIEAFPVHYSWIAPEGLTYFKKRLNEVRGDVDHALDFVLDNFNTEEKQHRACQILKMKLDILWSLLDAIHIHTSKHGNPESE